MLTPKTHVAMVGAGAIGGVTAAFIKRSGQDMEIVCKHRQLADQINNEGIHITGVKGEYHVKLNAVANTSELSGSKEVVFLATKATDCVAAAQDLLPFLTPKLISSTAIFATGEKHTVCRRRLMMRSERWFWR